MNFLTNYKKSVLVWAITFTNLFAICQIEPEYKNEFGITPFRFDQLISFNPLKNSPTFGLNYSRKVKPKWQFTSGFEAKKITTELDFTESDLTPSLISSTAKFRYFTFLMGAKRIIFGAKTNWIRLYTGTQVYYGRNKGNTEFTYINGPSGSLIDNSVEIKDFGVQQNLGLSIFISKRMSISAEVAGRGVKRTIKKTLSYLGEAPVSSLTETRDFEAIILRLKLGYLF